MEASKNKSVGINDWLLCLAPMMKKTDRHFRFLVKLIAPDMRLFTEMIPAKTILNGNINRHLEHSEEENPLVLQIGTADPVEIIKVTKVPGVLEFDEINLNCGCPSPTVQSGDFGVRLMLKPEVTRKCIETLRQHVPDKIPISVKIRLGVDQLYSYAYLSDFVAMSIKAGASVVFVHARKALLKINPKQNREIPDLNYEWVYKLKEDFSDTKIVINGGIKKPQEVKNHLTKVDGIMLGRIAYQNPMVLTEFESIIFNKTNNQRSRINVVEKYLKYAENQLKISNSSVKLLSNLSNIFHGQKGAKNWRLSLTQLIQEKRINIDKIFAKANKIAMIN